MPGGVRHGQFTPVTPAKEGSPPGWVVACLDCGFSVDEHGASAEDTIQRVAARHDRSHKLIARAVDYMQHPLY